MQNPRRRGVSAVYSNSFKPQVDSTARAKLQHLHQCHQSESPLLLHSPQTPLLLHRPQTAGHNIMGVRHDVGVIENQQCRGSVMLTHINNVRQCPLYSRQYMGRTFPIWSVIHTHRVVLGQRLCVRSSMAGKTSTNPRLSL